ncbi:MAG: FMN-binding negative transcriptional regulator [Candidatus Thiodiazotropha sp.]
MYIPRHFAQTDHQAMWALIRSHPFAVLLTQGPSGPVVDHLPFELTLSATGYGKLSGHVARANPMWRELSDEAESMAIFQGGQAYVSPSWYPSKQQTGRVVPTWNYRVVHARGHLRVIQDKAWLFTHLQRLTDQMEAGFSKPWSLKQAPEGFIDGLVESVVGIEMEIQHLTGKWKLSQNRSIGDQVGVAAGLRKSAACEAELLADAMIDNSSDMAN